MAYTWAQLVSYYTSVAGTAPTAAISLTLDALATQTQIGAISDAQAIAHIDSTWGPAPPGPTPDPVPEPQPPPEGGGSPPGGDGPPAITFSPSLALKTHYASVARTTTLSAADGQTLDALAARVGSGSMTLGEAQAAVAKMAGQAISVVNLTYQFFTGTTPYESGVDYLIRASDAAYRGVSFENRYISFAINLGKFGEGQTRFAAAYGDLSLAQALAKAYAEIFGIAPTDAKIGELLDARLVVGDQTLTRAEYFALYGQDGQSGVGTKAAMVGWLLAEAVKAGVGPYAQAQEAFLADLGPDGLARFHVDLLGAYGPHVAAPAGATIVVARDQSVSPSASDAAHRTTDNSDVITGAAGLDAGRTIETGAGDDRVTIAGVVDGEIRLGDGDSIVTLDELGATGKVTFGGGGNVVNLSGTVAVDASISAAGTNNTLRLTSATAAVLGTVTGFQVVVLEAPTGPAALSGVKGAQILYDMVPRTFGDDVKVDILAANHETVVLKDTSYGVVITDSTAAGASSIVIHLDHFTGAASSKVDYRNGPFEAAYSADGGSITILSTADPKARAGDGKVTLYVDSDSTAGMIFAYSPISATAGSALDPIKTLELRGTGELTAQIFETFTQIDASRAGDFDLTYAVAGGVGIDRLKTATVGTFTFSDWKAKLSVALGHAADQDYAGPMKFLLGAGPDTIVATRGALGLNNLAIVDQAVFVTAEVHGFKKGVDHLVLDAVSHGVIATAQAEADGAASLTEALTRVAGKVAAKSLAVFAFGGDTYVYLQDDQAGLNMGGDGRVGDGLIKLTGVTGLSVVTGDATGDIHWA